MPAWREHSTRWGCRRPASESLRRTNPRAGGEQLCQLWGFGRAAAVADDHFAQLGESWSRRWWRTGACPRGRGHDRAV